MSSEKPFVLEMLNDIKEYYQMPAVWTDKEKNYNIDIGYCPTCNEIKDITRTRRTFEGADCMGDHWSSRSVPLQCYDLSHKNVLQFNSKKFDYFLKYAEFFNKKQDLLKSFEIKDLSSLEKDIAKIKISNESYETFRNLIDKWKKEEIDKMHNPAYINTKEFSKLIKNYKKWNSMSWENQMIDIALLHKNSLKYENALKDFKEKTSEIENILK